jgi:hypothetical protein
LAWSGQQSFIATDVSDGMAISSGISTDVPCAFELSIDATEPAVGNIATDRPITRTMIVRTKCIPNQSTRVQISDVPAKSSSHYD